MVATISEGQNYLDRTFWQFFSTLQHFYLDSSSSSPLHFETSPSISYQLSPIQFMCILSYASKQSK